MNNYYLDMFNRLKYKLLSGANFDKEEIYEFGYFLDSICNGKIFIIDKEKFKNDIEVSHLIYNPLTKTYRCVQKLELKHPVEFTEEYYNETDELEKKVAFEKIKDEFVNQVMERYDL